MNANAVTEATSADDDRLLTHYFRFVVREESGPLRERLQRGLVERALKTGNASHTMTVANIQANIEKLTGVRSYPRELVNQALHQLVPRAYVEKVERSQAGDDRYRLSQARFEILEDAFEQVEQQEQAFRGVVADKIEAVYGPLAREERECVEHAFVDLVSAILGKIGEHCALNLVEHKHWQAASEYPRFHRDLEQSVAALPSELQDAARLAFEEALQTPTPEQGDYLYSIGQVFYVVELLHLDPELQALELARFEETRLFLDTNLLIAALLDEIREHDPVIALLRLCRSLRFHLCYSQRTVEEFESLIDAADEEYRRHPPFSHEMAAELAPAVASPFLRSYFLSWPKHKWSWGQFRTYVAAWRGQLEKEGILLDDTCPHQMSGRRYEHLKLRLGRATSLGRDGYRPPKRPRAAEHDAYMLSAIEQLITSDEAEAHPFGHRYWFLTNDRRLAECARATASSEAGSVCMLSEEWLQYISPFLSADVSREQAADVFARLLGSRFFVSLGTGIDLEDLQPFTTPNVKGFFEGLSREDACRAVAEAAQSEAVAAAERSKRPEVALDSLMGLIDARLREKQTRGELIPKAEVEQLRAEHEHDKAQIAESATEKDMRIRSLEQRLETAETELGRTKRQARLSPAYQLPKLRNWLEVRARWVKARWKRLAVVLAALGLAIAVEFEGWGGIALAVVTWLGVVLALLVFDTDKAKANWHKMFGSGGAS
jgi:hypothetical protein